MENPRSEELKAVRRLAFRAAMRQLPDAQYDAILYCVILGFTQHEVASMLGLDQSTIARNLISARRSLKKILSTDT